MVELERAINFYDANIKILNFSEKPGRGDHADPLLYDSTGKGKGKNEDSKGKGKKGKEKGKGEDTKKEE